VQTWNDSRPECSVCEDKSVVYEQNERTKHYTFWCALCYLKEMIRQALSRGDFGLAKQIRRSICHLKSKKLELGSRR
jgi:hypothetical protein